MLEQVLTDYDIKEIKPVELAAATHFVMDIVREVFPMLDPNELPPDMARFQEVYYKAKDAAFLAAFDRDGTIAATAAFLPYDDRIPEIKGMYTARPTAELVKCYVNPQLRRQGVGTAMVRQLLPLARAKGYETMYLHTHRFLPGAVGFWEAQGFELRLEPHDNWQTVHMDCRLAPDNMF
ncbi:GNAT family N-acetyltransferase [Paenibacillus thalictri]|uniref:GNAT family N-acetyltransferase n=1 Tax=Paenibacillus thalictri TaxID=2527873 RepID=UPI0013EF2EAE|nr:GNAT family N-acetyltransferase [Paenibacillus thalictri]